MASEKKDDFDRFADLHIRTHLSTATWIREDRGLEDADIVVATSEKADSMIRHGSKRIQDVGLVIADEIHMIHDPGRGPTLEVALTKLMRRNRDLQIIALSATISNADDLAEWLHAELVRSDWRPIPLKEGVFKDDTIVFNDRTTREVPKSGDTVWALVKQAVEDGGQSLVFVNSRRSTEALAVKFSKDMGRSPKRAVQGGGGHPRRGCGFHRNREETGLMHQMRYGLPQRRPHIQAEALRGGRFQGRIDQMHRRHPNPRRRDQPSRKEGGRQGHDEVRVQLREHTHPGDGSEADVRTCRETWIRPVRGSCSHSEE